MLSFPRRACLPAKPSALGGVQTVGDSQEAPRGRCSEMCKGLQNRTKGKARVQSLGYNPENLNTCFLDGLIAVYLK